MQVARHLGIRVLGTDREAKRAHIEAQGGILIDFEHEDVVERCRELTDGRGVDYAYDAVGASARASHRALRPGGRLVWFGMVTLLARGARDWRGSAKTVGNTVLAFAHGATARECPFPRRRHTQVLACQHGFRFTCPRMYTGHRAPPARKVLRIPDNPARPRRVT